MIESKQIQLSEIEIYSLLTTLDEKFAEKLRSYLDLPSYSKKLHDLAKHIVAIMDGVKVGFLAYYVNDSQKEIFIPYVCVSAKHRRIGIADLMLTNICEYADSLDFSILLEVRKNNDSAIRLYDKYGFHIIDAEKDEIKVKMRRLSVFSKIKK